MSLLLCCCFASKGNASSAVSLDSIWQDFQNGRFNAVNLACMQVEQQALQNQNDTLLADIWSIKGSLAALQEQLDTAIYFHLKTLGLRQAIFGQQALEVSNTYHNLGNCYIKLKNARQAKYYLDQCSAIRHQILPNEHPEMATLYHSQAAYLMLQKEVNQALEWYLKAYCIYQSNRQGSFLNQQIDLCINLAQAYFQQKQFNRSLAYYLEAQTILNQNNGHAPNFIQAQLLAGISNCYLALGDLSNANHFQQLSLQSFERSNASLPKKAAIMHNYGNYYLKLQDYSQAAIYFEQAKPLLSLQKNKEDLASCLNSLAICYLHQELYGQAIHHQEQAISILLDSNQTVKLATAYLTLAKVYNQLEKPGACNYYLKESETLLKQIPHQDQLLQVHLLRAQLAIAQEDFPTAQSSLAQAQKWISSQSQTDQFDFLSYQWLMAKGKSEQAQCHFELAAQHYKAALNVLASRTPKETIFTAQKMEATIQMAKCYAGMSTSKSDWEKTYHHYLKALSYQSALMLQVKHRQSSIELWSKLKGLYDGLVYSTLKLSAFNPAYAEQAINFSEAFRNPQLKAKIFRSSTSKARIELDKTIAQLELQKNDGNLLEEESALLLDSLQRLYRKLSNLDSESSSNPHPLEQNLAFPLRKLQKSIPNDKTIVKYHAADHYLAAFVLKQDTLLWYLWPKSKDLDLAVIDLYQEISTRPIQNDQYVDRSEKLVRNAHQLYLDLIAPIEDQLNSELILIPDGILSYIPFELLLKSTPKNPYKFRKHDYLLRTYQISYALSLALYQSSLDVYEKQKLKVLAVAPPFSGNIPGLNQLFASESEAKFAIQEFGGKLITQAAGLKQQLEQLVSQYPIFHISTHGILNDLQPEKSHLVFDELQNQENLYFSELYYMDLPCQLIVLSACETGIGKRFHGEGLLSLEHAFIAAGAKSVLSSKWIINDQTSANLITLFYRNLKSNVSKSKALQQAKINFIDYQSAFNPILGHPYYWSALTLSGDSSPLSEKKTWWPFSKKI